MREIVNNFDVVISLDANGDLVVKVEGAWSYESGKIGEEDQKKLYEALKEKFDE